MFSYKGLIIVTVIFEIIIFSNGSPKEAKVIKDTNEDLKAKEAKVIKDAKDTISGKSKDAKTQEIIDNILKIITGKFECCGNNKLSAETMEHNLNPSISRKSSEYTKCEAILKNFGFRTDAGFYNLSNVMQFNDPENDAKFKEHLKTKMNIASHINLISPEDIDHSTLANPTDVTSHNMMSYVTENLIKETYHSILDNQDDPISLEIQDNDQETNMNIEIASFLFKFFKDTSKSDCSVMEEAIMNPIEYCTFFLKRKTEAEENKKKILKEEIEEIRKKKKLNPNENQVSSGFFAYFANMLPILFRGTEQIKPQESTEHIQVLETQDDDEDQDQSSVEIQSHNSTEQSMPTEESKEYTDDEVSAMSDKQKKTLIEKGETYIKEMEEAKLNEEKRKTFINNCRSSIVDYKFISGGIEYAYDENNRYKCVLTSLNLSQVINANMQEGLLNYIQYHELIAKPFNELFAIFTSSSLCQNYLYKKMLKTQNKNLPQQKTIDV